MSVDFNFEKLFMSNCRMRKLNLYMQSSETLRRYILLDCKPTPDDLKEIESAIQYFQKLPVTILEELFAYFKSPNKEYYSCYILKSMEAWHVALFIYNGQTQLVMDLVNKDFDYDFFLDVCGNKLSNLEELKLPEQSLLSANACKTLCNYVPRLEKLSLLAVDIANFAIQFIANLPLKEVELGGMVVNKPILEINRGFVDPQLVVLCREDSIIRNSLRVFKIGDAVNMESYILILRSMPNLEYLDFSHGTWLTKLPPDLKERKFNLRQLNFCNLSQQVENEIEIAIKCCPLVSKIDLTTSVFSRNVLNLLTQWSHLTVLYFRVVSSRFFNENSGSSSTISAEECVIDTRGLRFSNLLEFSVRDRRNYWLLNRNNLINFLRICPQLQEITFSECNGFDDQTALQVSRLLSCRHVKRIHLEFCNLLRPIGIRHFLNIPSITDCEVDLLLTQAERRAFDIESLKEEAKRKGKNLRIEIIPRTLFHDLLARIMY